jgi:hypothetical protein
VYSSFSRSLSFSYNLENIQVQPQTIDNFSGELNYLVSAGAKTSLAVSLLKAIIKTGSI